MCLGLPSPRPMLLGLPKSFVGLYTYAGTGKQIWWAEPFYQSPSNATGTPISRNYRAYWSSNRYVYILVTWNIFLLQKIHPCIWRMRLTWATCEPCFKHCLLGEPSARVWWCFALCYRSVTADELCAGPTRAPAASMCIQIQSEELFSHEKKKIHLPKGVCKASATVHKQ